MSEYYCLRCKKPVELDKKSAGIACSCGCRILIKRPPTTVRRIKAI
jgi:DNA-directed RNA polymerase subunit RPC12/RpoP